MFNWNQRVWLQRRDRPLQNSDVIFQIQIRIFWITKRSDCLTIQACVLHPCSFVVSVAHAAIWAQTPGLSFSPVCAMGSIPECSDFHGCSPHDGKQQISYPSKHWSKPDQVWNAAPTSAAAYLHCGKAATCPKAQLCLPPMHVEQAGYFVAQHKMPASFFHHVTRVIAYWICWSGFCSVACIANS